ncbi:hypothetical protein [uncultured Acetobacteroides sp.]|uniref:hypothetical protein n=1 Tax=uncultured Acetobacteroides sp. TaxID=1760811 RepID=UPI0029F5B5F3|nr:hypothetical protein [uncultured Acetobacteroides sp.]
MKTIRLLLLQLLLTPALFAQTPSTSLTVGGDFDKFYPVVWQDANWGNYKATILEIGRSNVHDNSSWRGALMCRVEYHVTSWGHGANYISADVRNTRNGSLQQNLVAGWRDLTTQGSGGIIIWLRGGGTTYHYQSPNATIPAPVVYDGTDGRVAYQEQNGPLHSYKTIVDSYVNTNGTTYDGDFRVNGRIGIGANPAGSDAALSVKGKVVASEIKVTDLGTIPDYVFDPSYQLMDLKEVEDFTKENRHLPGIPSEAEFKKEGMDLATMNAKLLQKVEELTLYLIEKDKKITSLEGKLDKINQDIECLKAAMATSRK